MNINDLLQQVVKKKASDLHLAVESMPMLRVDGELRVLEGSAPLSEDRVKELVFQLLNEDQKDIFLANKELDFSFAMGQAARFRVNVFHERGRMAAALRYIPTQIRSIEQLNLPHQVKNFTRLPQGFVLVTGPTGHGKSTTLAAIINEINEERAEHIVTIEDPIEYVYPNRRSLVSQREMHLDTHSWDVALRSVLREDPNVVLIGEMRDYETIAAALTIAETGHLVFSTLHTNSAAQTIDRILDVFPEHQQNQVRAQLAMTLEGVVSQRLLPQIDGGRIPATEVLLANPAVQNAIREGKTHQIDNMILTSQELGMLSLEHSLARLVKAGKITRENALSHTLRPEELSRILKSK